MDVKEPTYSEKLVKPSTPIVKVSPKKRVVAPVEEAPAAVVEEKLIPAKPKKSRRKKAKKATSKKTKRSTFTSTIAKKSKKSSVKRTKTNRNKTHHDTDESRKVNLRFGSRQYTALVPKEIPHGLNTVPEEDLKLSYAHGFNGHYARCRNNLWKRDDELVYNLAGAIVCHDIDDNEQRFFTEHTEDVTAIAMHPTLPLMATGQLDEKGARLPRICIWNLDSLELEHEIEGFHQNAIYHLAFSHNGDFLYSCAGDCDCTLVMFDLAKLDTPKMKPIFTYSPISKSDVYGLVVCQNIGANNDEIIDQFISYGAKHLKTWDVQPSVILCKEIDNKDSRTFYFLFCFVCVNAPSPPRIFQRYLFLYYDPKMFFGCSS